MHRIHIGITRLQTPNQAVVIEWMPTGHAQQVMGFIDNKKVCVLVDNSGGSLTVRDKIRRKLIKFRSHWRAGWCFSHCKP